MCVFYDNSSCQSSWLADMNIGLGRSAWLLDLVLTWTLLDLELSMKEVKDYFNIF